MKHILQIRTRAELLNYTVQPNISCINITEKGFTVSGANFTLAHAFIKTKNAQKNYVNSHKWVFLGNHLNESDQVLLFWGLQLRHHGSEVVKVTVDNLWLSGVDRW